MTATTITYFRKSYQNDSITVYNSINFRTSTTIQYKHTSMNYTTQNPHIIHHKPNYRVRTPPLPWIGDRSIIPIAPRCCHSSNLTLLFSSPLASMEIRNMNMLPLSSYLDQNSASIIINPVTTI